LKAATCSPTIIPELFMLNTIIILLLVAAAAGVGYDIIDILPAQLITQVNNQSGLRIVTAGFAALLGGLFGVVVSTAYRRLERQIRAMPIDVLLTRSVGLVVGLLVANLTLAPVFLLPIAPEFSFLKPLFAILGSTIFCYLGITLADAQGGAFLRLFSPQNYSSILVAEGTLQPVKSKVIDTSSVIDGRIEELMKTGFVEGQLLIPQFVLQELQMLADSSNDMKRQRGRRGLDTLKRMQDEFPEAIVIHSANYSDLNAVDDKLIRFASEINGILLTNDYNLSKVANLQKVPVLNINDVAQALRPIYSPGDSLEIKIVKEGKEASQGIGYLDDGTMVVVEEGSQYLGNEARIVVTSALQTSAGRMIFAKPYTSAIAS
jgi:uncharacterized protein YacL